MHIDSDTFFKVLCILHSYIYISTDTIELQLQVQTFISQPCHCVIIWWEYGTDTARVQGLVAFMHSVKHTGTEC